MPIGVGIPTYPVTPWYLTPEQLFLSNLETIERAARFVARRGGLSPQDADDLAANLKLTLIDNDYAVLRGFAGRCSLGTYAASIAHRLLVDERMHAGGRWRPSAESKRAGEAAVLLEMLVVRDRKPLAEALPLVQKIDPSMTGQAAEALLARLPKREQRAQLVPLDERVPEQEVDSGTVEERVLERDREAAAAKTNAIVREVFATLSADDRVLLRLRFASGMRVAAIARAWQCDQQILYRRIETIVRQLRRQLIGAGIDTATVAELTGGDESRLAFEWDEKTAAIQTMSMKRRSGSEETVS
ncbi:MAG TPA: sigma-70 family RNA polymerase sigma factor [Thermoanaerobaculia bacterium]